MKRVIYLFLILIINYYISGDQTSDIKNIGKWRDNVKYFMKFRGAIWIGAGYYFGVQDGISYNNFSKISYEIKDYTTKNDPEYKYHTAGDKGRVIGTNWGGAELKLYVRYSFIAPFLTGDHFLFSNNNIQFNLFSELSPVSLNSGMSFTFTPIAFLKFDLGFIIGSGWSFFGLFNGLGRNINGDILSEPFYGGVLKAWLSPALQFDLAAIMPDNLKRWTHIVLYASPKIQYESLLNVSDNQPYLWEADAGENLNGFYLLGNFFLGYQIPIKEDDNGEDRPFIKYVNLKTKATIGFLLSIDKLHLTHYYDSPMNSPNGWGSDFCYLEFGPIFNIELPYNLFVTVYTFWKNGKTYTSETVGNYYYQNRDYLDWNVYFRRIDIVIGWNF